MEHSTNYSGIRGIMSSESHRSILTGNGTAHKIAYGDRIMIRLRMPDSTFINMECSTVSDMTEVLGEIRHLCRGKEGLARMTVRNASRGWSLERPLKLYGGNFMPRGLGNVHVNEPARQTASSPAGRRMLFPWETH